MCLLFDWSIADQLRSAPPWNDLASIDGDADPTQILDYGRALIAALGPDAIAQ